MQPNTRNPILKSLYIDVIQFLKVLGLRIARKTGLLKKKVWKLTLRLNGCRFSVPIINETGFNNHNMDEYWMLDLLRHLRLKPCSVFIDLGANVGQSMLKWKAVFPHNAGIMVEALAECCNYLTKLVHQNNWSDCMIIEKVVSNHRGKENLYLSYNDNTDRTASILRKDTFINKLTVEACTLDDIVEASHLEENCPHLLKMDVEGAESIIIPHSVHLLNNYCFIIVIEIISSNYSPESLQALFEQLRSIEYECYRIIKKRNRLWGLQKLEHLEPGYNIDESDFVFIKNEAAQLLNFE